MTPEEQQNLEKHDGIISADCNNCGSEMTFSAEKQVLLCDHCGNTRDLPKASDMIIENSFSEGIQLNRSNTGLGVETKVFHCNDCGSETAVDPNTVNFSCPFCGSTKVNEEAHALKVITPAGLIPFIITQKEASGKFKEWLKKGWFHPNDLQKIAKLDKLAGVYVPNWTYDAFTQSNWTAQAGYYYYETETYSDSEGNTQTRQVRRTRWEHASGYHEQFFDDVLVVASNGISQDMAQGIMPFQLEALVNYESQYLLGWNSEVYQKDVEEGFGVADTIMDSSIRDACARAIPGDTHRGLNVNTRKSNITFKHILLPTWVAGYRYREKVFQFLVNGQTGKINGKKPLSFWKIFFTVLGVAAIAGAIYIGVEDPFHWFSAAPLPM